MYGVCVICYGSVFLQPPAVTVYCLYTGSYALQYLGSNLYLAPYVTQALVQVYIVCALTNELIIPPICSQLIARITKDGWFNGDKKGFVFRDILDEVGKFLRVCW